MLVTILIILLVCLVITAVSILAEEIYYSHRLPDCSLIDINKKLKIIDECLSEETDYKTISFLIDSREYWINERDKLKKHNERNGL